MARRKKSSFKPSPILWIGLAAGSYFLIKWLMGKNAVAPQNPPQTTTPTTVDPDKKNP